MVKTMAEKPDESSSSSSIDANKCGITKPGERNNSDSCKYKGVRKRKWGKWVSEIRLPNSRERIWLGSYDSPVKAARAFDAALFCLRGSTAKFNLPDNPPEIPGGRSLTPPEIQAAAAQFANSEPVIGHSGSGQSASFSSRSDELQQVDSPCPSVSDGPAHVNEETTDASLLDQFRTMGWTNNSVPDFGIFPGFDDLSNEYYIPQPLQVGVDYGEVEEASGDFTSQGSFLWNF